MALRNSLEASPLAAIQVMRRVATSVGVVIALSWLFSYENVANLKFFGSGVIPFADVPFAIHTYFFGQEDAYLTVSCDQLSNAKLLMTTQKPLLFKGCIPNPENLSIEDDMVTFPDSRNNIYGACGNETVFRRFSYQPLEGDTLDIYEHIPCDQDTLTEKIRFHKQHNPTRDGPHAVFHAFHLDKDHEKVLEVDLKHNGFLPEDFSFSYFSQVTKVLAHVISSGRAEVYYHHSHMDRFLSFGIQTTKVWELINPKYHDNYDYVWSGSAIVLTREKKKAPAVIVEQEPGDVLLVAPWWLHKTHYKDTPRTKNVSLNLHMMTTRSLHGLGSAIFMRWMQNPGWFYSSAMNKKTFQDHGLEMV